jgi:hypothetical protein
MVYPWIGLPELFCQPFVEVEFGPTGIGPMDPRFQMLYVVPALAVLSNILGRELTGSDVNLFVNLHGFAYFQERLDHIPPATARRSP